jgi:cytochrome c5
MFVKVKTKAALFAMVSILGASFLYSASANAESLAERIAPVGSVCLKGEACANAVVPPAATSGARNGETIYNTSCVGCHGTGAAGAPKLGDKTAWAPRIEQGIDALYNSALNGKNAMPPKGTCMNCSEAELKATVDYLVEQAK